MLPGITVDAGVRALERHSRAAALSAARLSSGLRIQRSSHDPGGLALSEKMRAQERGHAQAAANIQDAMSFLRIGLDGLTSVNDILQRMREIAVQARNGTNDATALTALGIEWGQNVNALMDARAIAAQARLDFAKPPGQRQITVQAGPDSGMTMVISYENLRTALVGTIASLGAIAPNAATAITAVDTGLKAILREEANLGAHYNRLEAALAETLEAREMTAGAGSLMRDADMAADATALVKASLFAGGAARITRTHEIQRESATRLLGL
jgi:flagellin